MFYTRLTKRWLDLVISIPLILILSPFFCFLYLLVKIKLGSPVFFVQERLGKDCVPFKLVKFRSMIDERDEAGELLSDEQRLSVFGRFLRSTSADELPELWNVLRGEMSLVGPRPLLVQYRELYTPEQMHRHDIKPGLTGWSQVNGRNNLSWEDRFQHDLWYVQNQSLLLDFKIILLTFRVLFFRQGVSAESHATMPVFTGTSAHCNDFHEQNDKAA